MSLILNNATEYTEDSLMNEATLSVEPRSIYCEETFSDFALPEEDKILN